MSNRVEVGAPRRNRGSEATATAAHILSTVFVPPVVAIATFATLSFWFTATSSEAMISTVVASLFVSILPVTYIAYLFRRHRLQGGINLVHRQERNGPYLLTAASCGFGDAALWTAGAPFAIQMLAVGYGISAIGLAVINRYWKISAHAAGVGLGCGAIVTAIGMPALPVTLILPAVCWARVRMQVHSAGQVLAGATLGTCTGTLAIGLLRSI